MLTSETVKTIGKKAGYDLIGIANIERFKEAPVDMHPSTIFPETKSVIVCAKAIPRGSMRGIEEGTYWNGYDLFGYSKLNATNMIRSYLMCKMIECEGFEAVPLHAGCTAQEWEEAPRQKPNPNKGYDNQIHTRMAAAAAGLGELGWSKVFLTPEFGPRIRFMVILTDAKLEPDPLYKGKLCSKCMKCVKDCPGGALGGKKIKVKIEDRVFEWGDVDLGKCKLCHFGVDRKCAPFIAKDIPGLRLDVKEQQMTWKEAHDFGFALFPRVKYYWLEQNYHGNYPPICGAKGCIRTCMDVLEKERIIPGFKTPFIKRPRWELPLKIEREDKEKWVYIK
ncbi:MAG: hypothetical protein A3J83_05840 [Elusimicrobia bacterium RIFOXYA2_FULL_40_6]|nr:MAG: hypothetical protein A3J83_05840 [Elusimicrobia bacterium RIFOXYA2_FULL_40_6]